MSSKIDFERSLSGIARGLPGEPLPPALREGILNRLPNATARRGETFQAALKLAFVIFTVALIGILALSPILFQPKDPATEALAAMQGANTWHISGWKLKNLDKVPWEVWGQRKPFFYYEKLGDHITYDDGHYRVEVIPQDVYSGSNSLVIKTVSEPLGAHGSEYTFKVRGWRRGIRPKTVTAQDYVCETTYYGGDSLGTGLVKVGTGLPTQERLYVDKRTLYPDRYQVLISVDKDQPPVVVQDIKIELNKDLPTNIAAPTWPAGFTVMDMTVPQDTSKVPKENVAYKDGFSAQLTPLARDKNGDVLMRVRGWFGNTRLSQGSFVQFDAAAPISQQLLPKGLWPYHDNLGGDYVITWWPGPPVASPSGDVLFLYAPAAPIKPGQSMPKTMTISLSISAYLGGRYLVGRDLGWTVSLASTPVERNFDSYWAQQDPHWRKDWLAYSRGTLPAAADDARSLYWIWQAEPLYKNHADMLKMVKWEERAVADSVPISHQAQFYREMLANDYHILHEYSKERSELRERNSIGKRHPGI